MFFVLFQACVKLMFNPCDSPSVLKHVLNISLTHAIALTGFKHVLNISLTHASNSCREGITGKAATKTTNHLNVAS